MRETRCAHRRRSRAAAGGTRPASAGQGPTSARRGSSSSGRCMNASTSPSFCRLPFESSCVRAVEDHLEALDELLAPRAVDAAARASEPVEQHARRSSAGRARTRPGDNRSAYGSPRYRGGCRGRAGTRCLSLERRDRADTGSWSSCPRRLDPGTRTPARARPATPADRRRLSRRTTLSARGSRSRCSRSGGGPPSPRRPAR